MKLLSPTEHHRLNEITGFVLLALGLLTLLSLASYNTQDPSWSTAAGAARPVNLIGYAGSYLADFNLQIFGLAAFLIPVFVFLLAWKWIRSEQLAAPGIKLAGTVLLFLSVCAACSLGPRWTLFSGAIPVGGTLGIVLADWLTGALNLAGALILTLTCLVVAAYLVSSFAVARLSGWLAVPAARIGSMADSWRAWRAARRARRMERRQARAELKAARQRPEPPVARRPAPVVEELKPGLVVAEAAGPQAEGGPVPICTLPERILPEPEPLPVARVPVINPKPNVLAFRRPTTDLLNEPPARSAFDGQELQETALKVKSKFEEFNVLGSVVQINPGPVVTTFEFKPEAGIKYSRITTLTEDLCLGLQAESILIERIPGKPTVGIEVPNTRREVISLRQILESDEFEHSPARLAIPLGKDINGRIKVSALESMPHLLIAGSTGSGKSVMINSFIMSMIFRLTPDEVRLILIDPKRLELGLYEGIPHLLTPVITDTKKAANALRNAVLEMDRRLRLLAEYGVRNIEQFNKKIRKMMEEPRGLFDEGEIAAADLETIPYIVIIIDELADLMMLEGRGVEESVTRLAQMARAVGVHLVLATQRPSVDVITGLIKANFPARISFRVATRVDSRTILDVMGSEHLLGKGDMLFLPPGSSRLIRVHGALVTEAEINRVVEFWKQQAAPDYEQSYLVAPAEEEEGAELEEFSGEHDPMYEDALRVVLEMGKASTSTLQRRLRLGYGRAARILDMMQRDGIIGPPDGSKPREVLKRPDWLREVEDTLR